MEVTNINTKDVGNEEDLAIEQRATQRAEEITDLKAIPEFMKKKYFVSSSKIRSKPKTSVHPVRSDSPRDNADKLRNLYLTSSNGGGGNNNRSGSGSGSGSGSSSKISFHSESPMSVDTSQAHMHHHAHLHIPTKNKNGKNGKNGKSSNSSETNSSGLIDTKSSGQSSNESGRTQGSVTTWAAIDTLDDVRKLAMETKDVDYFQEDQEKALNQMRNSHIRLLKLMKGRNSRLEKGELVSDRTNWDRNDIKTDENTAKPNMARRSSHNFAELIPEPMDGINSMDDDNDTNSKSKSTKPIYVSDYSENLEHVELITSVESQYIDQMEQIIKDTDTL
ncbi:hypothetical protein MOSE0_L07118 [Monosporozyma servazzii]